MIRKQAFVYVKKGADQIHGNRAADQRLFCAKLTFFILALS